MSRGMVGSAMLLLGGALAGLAVLASASGVSGAVPLLAGVPLAVVGLLVIVI